MGNLYKHWALYLCLPYLLCHFPIPFVCPTDIPDPLPILSVKTTSLNTVRSEVNITQNMHYRTTMKDCTHAQDFTITEDLNVIIVHVLSNDAVKMFDSYHHLPGTTVTISSVSTKKETQTYIRVAFICKMLSS